MTKKILSLIICVALVCSTMFVANVSVSATDGYISDGYLIYEDFEDGTLGGFSTGVISEWDDGKAVHLSANSYYTIDLPDYYIYEFDINKTGNMPYNEDLSFKDGNAMNLPVFAIILHTSVIEKDIWYTYRIMVDQKELGGVTSNEVNRPNGIKLWRKVRGGQWENCVYNTHYRVSKNTAHGADGTVGFYAKDHTQFDIDNVKLFDGTYVSDIWFEDGNGKTEQIPQGVLTAKYDIANFGGFEEAVAVTAIYDAEGNLLNCVEKLISGMDFGNVTAEGESILMIDYPDAARVEAFLWTNTPEPQSMGRAFAVVGEAAEVEGSQTTTDYIAETIGAEYKNDFIAVDRSTFANVLTVEGVHETGKSAPVAIKVTADDRIVVATQFMSEADGSFKRELTLNPALCGDAEEVRVVVSGANTNPQVFTVPVFSNWDEMAEAFANAESASEIEEYLNNFKNNFSYYKNGETQLTVADVESLNQTDDFEDIEFVKSKTVYDDTMGYADVVSASIALVEAAEKVDEFETAFTAAKADGDAEEIGNLIENADFIEFPLSGVSNLAKVYAALADSEADMDSIADIYAEFERIHGEQKVMEEETIPSFKAVNSGASLKNFFAENFEVLGIDPEMYVNDKYDNDYDVMFGAYEGQFELCDTYEKVNAAIVFLDNYINEYNAFLDSINTAENGDAIRAILESEYAYIELGLVDSAKVENREYLFKEMENKSFESLDDVRTEFRNAVAVQWGRETNVLNDFMLINSLEQTESFFNNYGVMIGIEQAVDYAVFFEVYSRYRSSYESTVTSYGTAVAQAKTILTTVTDAKAMLADVNAKAESGNWNEIKSVYEGELFAELVGISVETPDVNDIRSMYNRIGAMAPFATLTAMKNAFVTAYAEQSEYEKYAGGYETFDEELLDFVESAWVLKVQGNVITLKGKVEERGLHNVSIYIEDKNGLPIYMNQLATRATGDFEKTLILNPEFYLAEDNTATLKVTGDSINMYAFSPFKLYGEDELADIIEAFLGIGSKREMEAFFNEYAEDLGLVAERDGSGKMTERAIEALYQVYSKNKADGKYDSIADVDEVINGKDGISGTEGLMATMGQIITCLDQLTAAANERIGSTKGNWSKIQKQVQLAIENGWISPDVSGKITSVDKLYLRMAGKEYDLLATVEKEYEKAYELQLGAEKESGKNSGGGSFGGGGGGGSSSGGSDGKITSGGSGSGEVANVTMGAETGNGKIEVETNLPGHPEAPFSDVSSEYSWAKDSINGLRRHGIISGYGDGTYRPGNGVSREEFLKILLDVFDVERKAADTSFTDVDKAAWYYDTVATAFELGIVKGYEDGRFGIGDTITRADMAVMVCRTMEMLNINLDATDEAFLFNDFTAIPEYAYSSVVKLQRAGIINGDTFGFYNPLKIVTRAESAVVFWSIYNGISEFIDYNWVTEYN